MLKAPRRTVKRISSHPPSPRPLRFRVSLISDRAPVFFGPQLSRPGGFKVWAGSHVAFFRLSQAGGLPSLNDLDL